MSCVVSLSEFVKTLTNKLLEKRIKNWCQSASSIHQTKQASKIRFRSNYIRALVVKFNKYERETLKFILSQFKSKTHIYSKYNKT